MLDDASPLAAPKAPPHAPMRAAPLVGSALLSGAVAALSCAGAQECGSYFTDRHLALSALGYAAKAVAGVGVFAAAYWGANRGRFRDEGGAIDWRLVRHDAKALMYAAALPAIPCMPVYFGANELALRYGAGPTAAGVISSVADICAYTAMLAFAAPRVQRWLHARESAPLESIVEAD